LSGERDRKRTYQQPEIHSCGSGGSRWVRGKLLAEERKKMLTDCSQRKDGTGREEEKYVEKGAKKPMIVYKGEIIKIVVPLAL